MASSVLVFVRFQFFHGMLVIVQPVVATMLMVVDMVTVSMIVLMRMNVPMGMAVHMRVRMRVSCTVAMRVLVSMGVRVFVLVAMFVLVCPFHIVTSRIEMLVRNRTGAEQEEPDYQRERTPLLLVYFFSTAGLLSETIAL
jgi:hypothetical protein